MTTTVNGSRARTDRERQLIVVFKVCNAFGISRGDRLEWATVVLDRNISTFRDLSAGEVARLVDAAHGAAYMARIWMERRRGERV